jgi:hypothetical protein
MLEYSICSLDVSPAIFITLILQRKHSRDTNSCQMLKCSMLCVTGLLANYIILWDRHLPPDSSGCMSQCLWFPLHARLGFWTHKGTWSILPSDLALVLQYGSGPSSDFLAKILGVDTPLLLYSTQFDFPLSSQLLQKSCKRNWCLAHRGSTVGSMYTYCVGNLGSIPQ